MMELFCGGRSTGSVVRSAKTAVCFSTKQARRACVVDLTHTHTVSDLVCGEGTVSAKATSNVS